MTWVIQPWKIIVSMWVIAIVFAVIGVIVGKRAADHYYAKHPGTLTLAWQDHDETPLTGSWIACAQYDSSGKRSSPGEWVWVYGYSRLTPQPKGPTTSTGDYKCEPPGCMSTQPNGAK